MEYVSPSHFLDKLTELGLTLKVNDTFHLEAQGEISYHTEDEVEFTFPDASTLYFTEASFFMGIVSHTESSLKLKLFA
jgi:hypothetical protein